MKFLNAIKEYAELGRLQSRMARHFHSFSEQKRWLNKLELVDKNVKAAHNQSHILQFLLEILELPEEIKGCIVEAGAFKGAGTAKISHFAAFKKRQLNVFDSFEGLPKNNEQHTISTQGHSIKDWFKEGNFAGSLDEVKKNVTNYGVSEIATFHTGWFENSLPNFKEAVAAAYFDVDLASSTKTCLRYLYPLLVPGGVIYSQDGDFPLVIDVFKDKNFWLNEVGCTEMPSIEGLGKKITIIRKK
jgi:O-methyltransferase